MRPALLLLLCTLLLSTPAASQEENAPAIASDERPQRLEPGLEARQQRHAPHTAKTVAMVPVRLIELPFKLLNVPIEKWLVRRRPDPLAKRIDDFVKTSALHGVTYVLSLESGYSGFGGGVGYRLPPSWTGPVNLRGFGGATFKGYELYYGQLDSLRLGRWRFELRGEYSDSPQEKFFGIGLDSPKSDRSTYDLDVSSGSLTGSLLTGPGFAFGFDLGFSHTKAGPGTDEDFPPAQDLFPDLEGTEGFYDFLETGIALTWGSTDHPVFPYQGNFARLNLSLGYGVNGTQNSFAKYGLELRRHVNLPGERRSLGLRLAGTVTDNLADVDIPFFRFESIGGSHTLRGLQDDRFTDKDRLLGGVEYRFPFWFIGLESDAAIDALLFYDFGTVKPNLETVQWRDFQNSGGFGFRIATGNRVSVRFDMGWSEDDTRAHLGFGKLH